MIRNLTSATWLYPLKVRCFVPYTPDSRYLMFVWTGHLLLLPTPLSLATIPCSPDSTHPALRIHLR